MPSQLDLFSGQPAPAPVRRGTALPVGPAVQPEDVAALGVHLPAGVFLGTSSWTFSGWQGLVYDTKAPAARLAREGLAAYAQHPVLRTVGVDRTFYGPVGAPVFSGYADQVPEGFRFLVKAHEVLTMARYPEHARYGAHRGQANPRFLDAAYAADAVVAPFVEGLGDKAGPLVFQFPPQDLEPVGGPRHFVDDLHAFLSALPRGPLYAVEVRNTALVTPLLGAALADVGAVPVLAGWRHLPPLEAQAEALGADHARALVVRWMLPPHLGYEEAYERYQPFDRLVDEDLPTREAIAGLAVRALRRGVPTYVTINNKAEGSAPLSAVRLAEAVVLEATRP